MADSYSPTYVEAAWYQWWEKQVSHKNSTFSQPFKKKYMSKVVRISCIISIAVFRLSKLWIATFFILCDIIFLLRLQEELQIDHSRELKLDTANEMIWNLMKPNESQGMNEILYRLNFFCTSIHLPTNQRQLLEAEVCKAQMQPILTKLKKLHQYHYSGFQRFVTLRELELK